MALVAWAVTGKGKKALPGVAVTGELNLRGHLTSITDLDAKIKSAWESGCQKLVAPADDVERFVKEHLEEMPPYLREYAEGALHPAKHMLDVIFLSLEGERGIHMRPNGE